MVALSIVLCASMLGMGSTYSHYQSMLPNGDNVKRNGQAWGGVGHRSAIGGGFGEPLNPFGYAFKGAGSQWTEALCQADSDNDGQTNGFELGDPDCIWTYGGTPSRVDFISHPGFADSLSAAPTPAPPTQAPTSSPTPAPVPPATPVPTAAQSQSARTSTELGGRCEFDNEPIGVGHFWDPTCEMGMLGCDGDGKNIKCRVCGAGNFSSVPCPPSSCHFPQDPFVPYYWDNDCAAGMVGCWADGIHGQCRFCGDYPFTGVPCPEGAAAPPTASCAFDIEPETPYFWDASCYMGKHGCNADGENVHCRFCGGGDYADIHCPGSHVCEFAVIPTVPYYWDPNCTDGMLGCKADGVNPQCRFCAERPFESVTCPVHVAPPEHSCHWPQRGEPNVPHFWDETCEMGKLGCWADGVHAQCRFCGQGVFRDIACPDETESHASGNGPLLL